MYTEEIKKLCIKIYNKIKSLRKVECLTNVSKSTISRWNLCKENLIKNNKNKIPLIIDAVRIVYKMNIYFTIKDVIDYVKKKKDLCGEAQVTVKKKFFKQFNKIVVSYIFILESV